MSPGGIPTPGLFHEMSRTVFTRQDCAELWFHGLSDREQRAITEAAEGQLGITPGLPPPTILELWTLFNSGRITLGVKTTSLEP